MPYDITPRRRQFLDALGKSEGADYNVLVGGRRFDDLTKHPRVYPVRTKEGRSSAAGKYQITAQTYDDFAPQLGITDFSPTSQDTLALAIIDKEGALADVDAGNWKGAIDRLGKRWASLPSSSYPQHKRSWDWIMSALGGATPAEAADVGEAGAPPGGRRRLLDFIPPEALQTTPLNAVRPQARRILEMEVPQDYSPEKAARIGQILAQRLPRMRVRAPSVGSPGGIEGPRAGFAAGPPVRADLPDFEVDPNATSGVMGRQRMLGSPWGRALSALTGALPSTQMTSVMT